MKINIRQATTDDLDLIIELTHPVQDIHVKGRPDVFIPLDIGEEMRELVQKRLSDPDTYNFIAEAGGVVAGYVLAIVRRRGRTPFQRAFDLVLVDQISVNPEHRSKGIGAALMERVYELAREQGIERVTLDVWAFNEDAIRFYEREDFSVYNVRMEKVLE